MIFAGPVNLAGFTDFFTQDIGLSGIPGYEVRLGDAVAELKKLPPNSIQTAVTSPPYWMLRDYGTTGQIGREDDPEHFITALVKVFRELRRTLRPDGTLWLNLGDGYAGTKARGFCKPTELLGMPWRVALALSADGWYLRSEVIWHKSNPMPESVRNRPTRSHEHIFLLTKSKKYYFDAEAIKEAAIWASDPRANCGRIRYGGKRNGDAGTGQESFVSIKPKRNKRTVWNVAVEHFRGAHFAVFPKALVTPCILAGSRPGDIVCDPFSGAGTTGTVATTLGRHYVGIELSPEYRNLSLRRIAADFPEPAIRFDDEPELPFSFVHRSIVPLPFEGSSCGTLSSVYVSNHEALVTLLHTVEH